MTSASLTKPLIPTPFADNLPSLSAVPEGNSGGDSANEVMCWRGGFPSIYGLSLEEGGKYVTRAEMNMILKALSQCLFYNQNGGVPKFDADVASAIGGYPMGAVLWYTGNVGTIAIQATRDNVATAPSDSNIDMDGSHGSDTTNYPWRKVGFGALPITGGTMSGDNITIDKVGNGYLQLVGGASTGNPGYMFVTGNGSAALRSGNGSSDNDHQIHVDQSGAWADNKHIVTGVRVNGGSTIYADSNGELNVTVPQGAMISSDRYELYRYKTAGDPFVVPTYTDFGTPISSLLVLATAFIEWDEQATVYLILESGQKIPIIGSRIDGADVAPTITFTAVMAPGTQLVFEHQRGKAGHLQIYGFI